MVLAYSAGATAKPEARPGVAIACKGLGPPTKRDMTSEGIHPIIRNHTLSMQLNLSPALNHDTHGQPGQNGHLSTCTG